MWIKTLVQKAACRQHCTVSNMFQHALVSKESHCTRRVIPRHDSHARRAMTREKSLADLAARWMISCRPYVNVRHYLLATADIQTCATLCDILPSLTLLPPPGDRFSRHLVALSLSCSLLLSIFLSSRTRLFFR